MLNNDKDQPKLKGLCAPPVSVSEHTPSPLPYTLMRASPTIELSILKIYLYPRDPTTIAILLSAPKLK